MTFLYVALIVLVLLAALYLFLIFPKRAGSATKKLFAGRSYAHRGLFNNEAGCPENSLAAFEAAMQAGFGCELDVQFTKDKQLIVFHDNDYLRACGVDTPVWELTYDEIRDFRLFGSEERVPLFREVLAAAGGRQPLIVEIKAEGVGSAWYYELCAAALAELRDYSGAYCVESFHPLVVRWFKKNAGDVVRGQLLQAARHYEALPGIAAFLLGETMVGFLGRPHFIAYREDDLHATTFLAKKLGAMLLVWTVRDPARHRQLESRVDGIIFDHYTPEPRL